jgi:2-polyprenyl-3-methyl-5-hydroxy-6-metoxy-1,4-benzoquinol methylase
MSAKVLSSRQAMSSDGFCHLCDRIVPARAKYAQRGTWSYLRCPNCGLVLVYPSPDDKALQDFYNNSYQVDFDSYFKGTRRRSKITLNMLAKHYPKPGRLLEVGCSYGGFLDEARLKGWDVTGVELSQIAATFARDQLGLRVFCGDLREQLQQLGEPYDVVAIFHVIEHLPNPPALLELCRKLIKPGGLLILKTPNVASSIARLMGSSWHWMCPPAHLYLYSPATLGRLLAKSGYQALTIQSSQGDAHNNLFAIASGIGRRALFQPNVKSLAHVRRKLPLKIVEAACEIFYYPFRILVDPWLSASLRQPELFAVARNGK